MLSHVEALRHKVCLRTNVVKNALLHCFEESFVFGGLKKPAHKGLRSTLKSTPTIMNLFERGSPLKMEVVKPVGNRIAPKNKMNINVRD